MDGTLTANPDVSFPVLYSDIMNNKVFYQHPNLMRALGMHETVMEVMVNVLGGGESKVTITLPETRSREKPACNSELKAVRIYFRSSG